MHDYTKYFKETKGFDRFINNLYKKYKSLSKIVGTVKLNNISEDEAIALSSLFGSSYKTNDDIIISIKKFVSIMNNSKYTDFDIYILVSEYLNISLISNKEIRENKQNKENIFYEDIIENSKESGSSWLKEVITSKKVPYNLIHQRYNKDKNSLKEELINIINLINNLPKEKTLISIYASNYTKDPHYLDLDNNHINLFLYALSYINKTSFPNSREDKIKLLSKFNIEIDNLSNFVLTYNLISDKEYVNIATESKESLILNIQNIINAKYFDTKTKKVFIFENPSILTEIISKNLDISVIITGGFPNSSFYLLLDYLIKTNNEIYYNGDFDPEELIIANKLKEKYPNLNLFCYEEIDYKNCISNKEISNKRLSKLSNINEKDIKIIKELLEKNKLSAYQENNKNRIVNYVKEW